MCIYIYIIFWLKAPPRALFQTVDVGKRPCLGSNLGNPFLLAYDMMAGGFAPSSASDKTQLRRLHRKHSQHSYKLLKLKLLNLVRPMPATAIHVQDLETFRASLFTIPAEVADKKSIDVPSLKVCTQPHPPAEEPIVLPASVGIGMCSWCGIWQPLPIAPICSQQMAEDKHGALGNQPTVARHVDAVAAESDPDNTRLGELGNQPTVATEVAVAAVPDPLASRTPHAPRSPKVFSAESMAIWKEPLQASFLVQTRMRRYSFKKLPWHAAAASCNNDNIGAIIPKVSYIPDMFEYLTGTPMLCEVVSLMRGGGIGQKYDQCLRSQRAAALRARSVGRCVSLSWLAAAQVTSSQYSTDPSTGECKTQ